MGEDQTNAALERNLELASEGSEEAVRAFYLSLLSSTLYVPDRRQARPMSHEPQYPNDFARLLGIQDRDRVVIPVFTRAESITGWCGHELQSSSYSLARLIDSVPPDWWLVLNPGAEHEKEISPWELEQLRGGEQGIPALLSEVLQPEAIESIELKALTDEEFPELRKKLSAEAAALPLIRKLFLVREIGRDVEGKLVGSLIVGVYVDPSAPAELNEVEERIRNAAAFAQIGAEQVKVRAGHVLEGNLLLGIFSKSKPFYERPTSIWRKIGSLLARS